MKQLMFFAALGLACLNLGAQNHPKTYKSLDQFFKAGHFTAHARTFFMGTANEGRLKDDYALTTGAGIGYRSEPFKGFGFGLNGFFIFDVFSSDLEHPEVHTGQMNRYELALLDITHPENKKDLDRLEEAYIYYQTKNIEVELGRMCVNTPFINGQDGRMRPSLQEGIWVKKNTEREISYQGGWFWAASPRSTVLWYKTGESIGTHSVGKNVLGKKSMYEGNVESAGVGFVGLAWKKENFRIQLWNTTISNISNTVLLQHEQLFGEKETSQWMWGVQLIRQDRIGDGGNQEESLRYQESEHAEVISTRLQYEKGKNSINFNYTRITNSGRFLFPREWGRDPFYTFISRERSEGNGGVNAFSMNVERKEIADKHLKAMLSLGYYQLPGAEDWSLSKYGLHDYFHTNLRLEYQPTGAFEGFCFTFLAMMKLNTAGSVDEQYLYNKSNVAQLNFIIDYYFGKRGH